MSDRLPSQAQMERSLAQQAYAQGRCWFKVAFGILRNAAGAEDACQQAFLKAWEHRAELRSQDALRAWLTRTLIHECLSVYRRRRTEERVLARQATVSRGWAADDLNAGEQREKVLASIAELPEPIRTVVVLRLLEGLPGNQVKELLECSAVDVSRQLHQGMDMLREKMRAWQVTAGEL